MVLSIIMSTGHIDSIFITKIAWVKSVLLPIIFRNHLNKSEKNNKPRNIAIANASINMKYLLIKTKLFSLDSFTILLILGNTTEVMVLIKPEAAVIITNADE